MRYRSISYGLPGGPLFHEVRSFTKESGRLTSYVYGLGGRDVTPNDLQRVFTELDAARQSGESGEVFRYIGLRDA